jgi:uncharacterized iron-regulated membrane protein
VKALWVILGFAPPVLFFTGVLMWWNRVLHPAARRFFGAGHAASIEQELPESRSAAD